MSIAWTPRPIPRFEYEDDEFYARVQEQYDHWEAVLYRKVRNQRGAMLVTSELIHEDRSKDEAEAKAFIQRMIERERRKK